MKPPLPRRCVDTLRAIEAFIVEHDYAPSIREIGSLTGLSSASGVHRRLRELQRRGLIVWEERQPRTLRVVIPDAEVAS